MSALPDPSECLEPTEFIDFDAPNIRACVESLALGSLAPKEQAIALFEYVRDNFVYEFGIQGAREQYKASVTMDRRAGFCVTKSILLCALGRSHGIPSALVLSDMRDGSLSPVVIKALGTDVMHQHGLGAFYLNDRWVKMDSALSPELVEKKGYQPIEFDGEQDALHASTTLSGDPHMEYLAFHGIYPELPYDLMVAGFMEGYRNRDSKLVASIGMKQPDSMAT